MKVILREDVKDLGEMGSIVEVKIGYGRNYLIPRNFAVEANPKNLRQFEHEKKNILLKAKKVKQSLQDVADRISGMTLTIEAQAGEEDKLFGSVTSKDIAEAIALQGVEIDKRRIVLEEPIKRLGTYEVTVKMHKDVTASVKVEVKKSGAEEA
jgi:large subunit ribosomal protein L9